MPRDDRHNAKAQRNEQFAESLDHTDATQENWAVVAVFYSALHYVQAVLSGSSINCKNHLERADEIARDPILKYVAGEYEYLFTTSMLARYGVIGLVGDPYRTAKARLEAIKKQVAKKA